MRLSGVKLVHLDRGLEIAKSCLSNDDSDTDLSHLIHGVQLLRDMRAAIVNSEWEEVTVLCGVARERAQQGVLPKCIVPELGIIVQEVAIRNAKDEILRELQDPAGAVQFLGGDGNVDLSQVDSSKIRSLCERVSDIGRIPQSLKRIVEVGEMLTEARDALSSGDLSAAHNLAERTLEMPSSSLIRQELRAILAHCSDP